MKTLILTLTLILLSGCAAHKANVYAKITASAERTCAAHGLQDDPQCILEQTRHIQMIRTQQSQAFWSMVNANKQRHNAMQNNVMRTVPNATLPHFGAQQLQHGMSAGQ